MARAFTTDDIIQSVPGTAVSVIDPGVTLSPVTGGNFVIIMLFGIGGASTPEQWDVAAMTPSANSPYGMFCRADIPAGETTWPFHNIISSATNWVWLAEEWTNVARAPIDTSAATGFAASPTSVSTGTTGTINSEYVIGFAALVLYHSTAGGATAWPSVSWSNGFTETNVVSLGTGGTTSDIQLRVARRYGTQNETGTWETTATFTGTMTNITCYSALAVFRAEELIIVPPPMTVQT